MASANAETRKALRQYYKCPCGKKEQNDKSFGIIQDKNNRWKMGEMMQKQVEKVAGAKPSNCAWWSLQRDPFVSEVLNIFNLAKDYPHVFNDNLPSSVYQGVIAYRKAIQRSKNWWANYDEKKREEKERRDKLKQNSRQPQRRY